MIVVATKPGFFGKLREPGDEFKVPDGSEASWFRPAGHEPKESKPVQPPRKTAS